MIMAMDVIDPDACYRALSTRDARFDGRLFVGVKTTGIYCRPICPARTPQARERALLPHGRGGPGGRLPPLPALPAGDRRPISAPGAASSNTVARALALIEAGALDEARRRRPGRAARRRRAPAAPAVPPASRRLAGRGRADAARAAGQAADPRDAAADGRGRAGRRVRQRPAVQRDLPAPLRAARRRAAPPRGRRRCGRERRARRCDSALRLPAAL